MTLSELYQCLKSLPGHDNIVLEDYRITQEVYDPGNPDQVHYYLTGPDTFFLFMVAAGEGHETTLEEYKANTSVG